VQGSGQVSDVVAAATATNQATTATNQNTGSGTAYYQPFLAVNYIIKHDYV